MIPLLALSAAGGLQAAPVGPLPAPAAYDVLQYDDGTAAWLSYDKAFYGTWFDLEDFCAGSQGCLVTTTEYWFFHHVGSYHLMWDTDLFGVRLMSGGAAGPAQTVDATTGVAVHYSAVYVEHFPPVQIGGDFWVVTRHSEWNGSPHPVMDIEALPVPHSFWSPDGQEWEATLGDQLRRVHCTILSALEERTWGSIKGLFGD